MPGVDGFFQNPGGLWFCGVCCKCLVGEGRWFWRSAQLTTLCSAGVEALEYPDMESEVPFQAVETLLGLLMWVVHVRSSEILPHWVGCSPSTASDGSPQSARWFCWPSAGGCRDETRLCQSWQRWNPRNLKHREEVTRFGGQPGRCWTLKNSPKTAFSHNSPSQSTFGIKSFKKREQKVNQTHFMWCGCW